MASARAERLRKKSRERKSAATKYSKTPSRGLRQAVAKADAQARPAVRDSRYQPQEKQATPQPQANDQRQSTAYNPDGSLKTLDSQQSMAQQSRDIRYQQARVEIEKPGGWKNVGDVLNLAVNPFAQGNIVANVGEGIGQTTLEAMANNPFSTALLATGVVGAARATVATVGKLTAAPKVFRLGMGTAAKVQTNTATTKATASMLTKMIRAAKSGPVVVGALMGMIGSYPFAGFIKEEALQTLSFGVKAAIDNNDLEGADTALELQAEVLDPGLWNQIFMATPYANVLVNLRSFYEAARIKMAIDVQVVESLRNGESDDELWEAKRQQRLADEKATGEAIIKNTQRIIDMKAEASDEERRKETEYWNKVYDR